MNPDYLPTLRERFGDDAGTREPDPDAERTDEPDAAGEWLGRHRVEAIQPRGEFL